MQSMFGGGAPQEDMFAKLDAMREIITEVNTQFKDPVSRSLYDSQTHPHLNSHGIGKDDIRLRLHLRVPLAVRDGTAHPGIDAVRDRHAQHRRQPAPLPQIQYAPTLIVSFSVS